MNELNTLISSDENFEPSSYYEGSRIFSSFAQWCGLSVDLINFLVTQGLALILATVFRSYMHPSRASASLRHAFGLVVGLCFGYFCFGQQAIHIAGLPAVCYIVIRTQNPRTVQRTVMLVALFYLSCIHLHRQYYDYGSYTLDITGPLMIITQKVTSLAFSIHDGFMRDKKELTKSQMYHAVQKVPSPLEYFSYVLHFQGVMAGPLVFYRDYIEFIEGYDILKKTHTNGNLSERSKRIVREPSPTKAVIKKVIACVVCAYIFIKLITVYPIKNMKDDAFINDASILHQIWYIQMSTMAVRFKYYFAWILSDAICNQSGLGFNGYDADGSPKWDLLSNIYVIPFELGTNFRDCINNWNIGTNLWLRSVVYERVPKKYGTLLTFSLSALWHGFYPGYYLTFSTGAVFVIAGRKARRMFRHRFQKTELSRTIYDALTCFVTRIFMGYATFPFVLLEFDVSLRLYLKYFMCLHLVALATIFIFPKIIGGEKRSLSSSKSNTQTNHSSNGTLKTNKDLSSTGSNHHCNNNNNVNSKCNTKDLINNQKPINYADELEIDDDNFKDCSSNSCNNKLDKVNSCDKNCNGNKCCNDHHQYHQEEQMEVEESNNKSLINDTNYLLKDLINNKIKDSDNLSNLIKEKIENCKIEGLIDKTVNGIVELKDDLMRINSYPNNTTTSTNENLRKRINVNGDGDGIMNGNEPNGTFLKKEIDAINAAVQQANVLPAVLSNGHGK